MKRILSALFILCFSVAHAEMPDNQAMKDRAKAFIDQNYGQIQEQIAGYKKRITESAGYSDETCHKEIPDKSLYVFISSSMPMATLQAYAADIRHAEGILMVMNGVVGSIDKIMPTIDFTARVSCGKGLDELTEASNCLMAQVDINPYLFRAFNVKSVPAFVHSNMSYAEVMQKVTMGEAVSENSYLKLSGDVSLMYALEKFQSAGVAKVSAMISNLKRGFYDK
jgi:conjugal transfer pilus assembly protein TrbC